jgi:hypothetical protein
MLGPVGYGDGTDDGIPALRGVAELSPEPVRWNKRVSVGSREPYLGGREVAKLLERRPHSGLAGDSDIARAGLDDDSTGRPGQLRGHVGASISSHHDANWQGGQFAGGPTHRCQACRQQSLLVVRWYYHRYCLDHTSPPACATETGAVSVRM